MTTIIYREFDGNKWRTIREAEKTDAEQVSRPFLAAMLRRADGAMASMISEAKRAAMEEIEAIASLSLQAGTAA